MVSQALGAVRWHLRTHRHTAQIGYVRGIVVGDTLVGEWFEVGVATSEVNRGNFTLMMGDDGSSFTGTWTYGPTGVVAGSWNETRLSNTRPADGECFASSAGPDGACCSFRARKCRQRVLLTPVLRRSRTACGLHGVARHFIRALQCKRHHLRQVRFLLRVRAVWCTWC